MRQPFLLASFAEHPQAELLHGPRDQRRFVVQADLDEVVGDLNDLVADSAGFRQEGVRSPVCQRILQELTAGERHHRMLPIEGDLFAEETGIEQPRDTDGDLGQVNVLTGDT